MVNFYRKLRSVIIDSAFVQVFRNSTSLAHCGSDISPRGSEDRKRLNEV